MIKFRMVWEWYPWLALVQPRVRYHYSVYCTERVGLAAVTPQQS